MIIDCHTHAFSKKIADKAVAQLIEYYQLPTSYGGTFADLCTQANAASLDALVLLVAATRPDQVRPANDWILSLIAQSPRQMLARYQLTHIPCIIPFGAFHPDDEHWLEEVGRLRAAGIRGIKLHPEFQGIDLADRRLDAFFEEVQHDFFLMIHVGDPKVSADNLSTPGKLATILDRFPALTLIAAHMGGYCFWEEACERLAGRRLFLDTSSAIAYMDTPMIKRIIEKHGSERILFGSDYPLRSSSEELATLERLHWLTASQRDAICGGNAAALFGISADDTRRGVEFEKS